MDHVQGTRCGRELFISLPEVVKKLPSGKVSGDVEVVLAMDWLTRTLRKYGVPGLLLWVIQSLSCSESCLCILGIKSGIFSVGVGLRRVSKSAQNEGWSLA